MWQKNRGYGRKTIMDRLKIEETKYENDLNVFFEINSLDEIVSIEEVEEYIKELKELSKTYRHTHLELTVELGDAYVVQYPNYNKIHENVILGLNDAKAKLRNSKIEKDKLIKLETGIFEQNELRVDEKLIRDQISQYLENQNLDEMGEIDEIRNMICGLETHASNYFKLRCKMEFVFGENFTELSGYLIKF